MIKTVFGFGAILALSAGALSFGEVSHDDSTDWRLDREFGVHGPRPLQGKSSISAFSASSFQDFTIDPAYLRQKLTELSSHERGSADGRAWARSYLKAEFEALGYTTSEQSYGKGTNFVAERKGTDPSKFLILSAHVDSMGNAGADDDGSGVISSLAIARALKDHQLGYSLRFVGFDQEELGLVGSKAYVASIRQMPEWQGLIGDINIEMTGYDRDGDGAIHVMDCDHSHSLFLSDSIVGAIQALSIPLARIQACTDRSDHASFWRAEKAAVVVSQNFFGGDSNPCYHRSCDTVDQVNFDYMAKITRALASATAI
jgi:Zn-dependent M28 family amino/carboxypeptidase